MDSSHLKPEQARRLAATIARHARYLARIEKRMFELEFPAADPLVVSVVKARTALEALRSVAENVERGQGRRWRQCEP